MDLLKPLINPAFTEERKPDDIDLVAATHAIMAEQNWAGAANWLQEDEITRCSTMNPDGQRFLIARNLSARFCGLKVETRAERLMLNAQGPHEEFLKHMAEYIVPALNLLYPQG